MFSRPGPFEITLWGVKPFILLLPSSNRLFEDQYGAAGSDVAAGMRVMRLFSTTRPFYDAIYVTGAFCRRLLKTIFLPGDSFIVSAPLTALFVRRFAKCSEAGFGGLPFELHGRTAWLQTAYSKLEILPLTTVPAASAEKQPNVSGSPRKDTSMKKTDTFGE
jgi:hypothetical protein